MDRMRSSVASASFHLNAHMREHAHDRRVSRVKTPTAGSLHDHHLRQKRTTDPISLSTTRTSRAQSNRHDTAFVPAPAGSPSSRVVVVAQEVAPTDQRVALLLVVSSRHLSLSLNCSSYFEVYTHAKHPKRGVAQADASEHQLLHKLGSVHSRNNHLRYNVDKRGKITSWIAVTAPAAFAER